MPLRKTPASLLTKAITKLAIEVGSDLASEKNLKKLRDTTGLSDKQVRTYANIGRKGRDQVRHDFDDEDEDSEEEYERRRQQQHRKRRGSSSRPQRHDSYDDDEDDRYSRHAPPPIITGAGPSSSSRKNGQYAAPQMLQPAGSGVVAGQYAYDEYGNPYPINSSRKSSSNDQGHHSRNDSRTGGSRDDSGPRPRRMSSVNQDRPHVAFADELDERDRADRPIPVRHRQQEQQQQHNTVPSPQDIRAVPPPALPTSISMATGSAAAAASSSSQGNSASNSPYLTHSPQLDTHTTASMGGPGIPIRDIVYAARCAQYVYSLTSQKQAEAFVRTSDANPSSHPTLLDVIFDNPVDNVRNCAIFRRRSDHVLFLTVRGSGKKGSEWATDMLRNVVGGAASMEDAAPAVLQDGSVLYAHAGLLQLTMNMMRQIIPLLEKRSATVAKLGPPRLVICGHSSGGAIASLIFIMLEHNYQSILDRFRTIQCISFGSPPCVRTQDVITSRPQDQMFGLVMNGDPIPRMDLAYAADILQKYPVQVSALFSSNPRAASQGDETVESTLMAIATAVAGREAEVPKQRIVPAGKLVLLHPQETNIWDMSKSYLEESAYYNISVHGIAVHLQSLERLEAAHPDITLD